MPTLVSDIINQAFLDLQVTQPGETISSAMQTDAFLRLNQLLASLSTEGATVPNQVEQTFSLVAGSDSYTLGASGIFVTAGAQRAMKITSWRASYLALRRGGPALRMEDFAAAAKAAQDALSEDYRRALMAGVITAYPATLTSPVPEVLGADTSYPNINLRISPAPSNTPGTLELGYWTPLAAFATVGDVVSLPPGFEDMLHFNLAVRLAPQYSRTGGISQELAANAQNSKASIVQQNTMGAQPAPQGQ